MRAYHKLNRHKTLNNHRPFKTRSVLISSAWVSAILRLICVAQNRYTCIRTCTVHDHTRVIRASCVHHARDTATCVPTTTTYTWSWLGAQMHSLVRALINICTKRTQSTQSSTRPIHCAVVRIAGVCCCSSLDTTHPTLLWRISRPPWWMLRMRLYASLAGWHCDIVLVVSVVSFCGAH